jgi:nitrilase
VYIDNQGQIQNVHRKLTPTYEERLTWSPGDGHGLRTFPIGGFTMGAFNCGENWMPLPRTALYAQGKDLHVAIWQGGEQNTQDITCFIAKEGRNYVMSVSGLMRPEDFPADTPYLEEIMANAKPFLVNGGSCIATPNDEWVIEPQAGEEGVYVATIDQAMIY